MDALAPIPLSFNLIIALLRLVIGSFLNVVIYRFPIMLVRDGLDDAAFDRIVATQLSRTERLAAADDILENPDGLAALLPCLDDLHRRYLMLAAQRPAGRPVDGAGQAGPASPA